MIIKRFDKNLGKFIKEEVDSSLVLKNSESFTAKLEVLNKKPVPQKVSFENIKKYEQKVFVEVSDLEIINTMKDFIERFDFHFFEKHSKDINAKLFKEKLYTLDRRITSYFIAKKTKDNEKIETAIFNFKEELKGYKSLKEAIKSDLYKYNLDKKKKLDKYRKSYLRNKTERVSRFGHESYGCVLSVSSGRRGSF